MPDYISSATRLTLNAQTTTDTYADLVGSTDFIAYNVLNVLIKNTGLTNSATVKILGSFDAGANYDIQVINDTVIAPGILKTFYINTPFSNVKIQIKATSAGNQTTVSAKIIGQK